MLHITLYHWFFIHVGLTFHPLAWYSLVHCIGTSHWLLLPIGNYTLVTHIGSCWIRTIIIGTTVVPKCRPFHIGSDIRWLIQLVIG